MSDTTQTDVLQRIQDYLLTGGLFNPELAIHDRVRDLLIDCGTELAASRELCRQYDQ